MTSMKPTRYFLVENGETTCVAAYKARVAADVPALAVIDSYDNYDEAQAAVERLNSTDAASHCPVVDRSPTIG